jgi:STE24 endopeptidase
MKISLGVLVLGLLLAVGWGVWAGQQPTAPRVDDMTTSVGPEWYSALPRDPQAATAAYLARVPQAMRDRGEAVADTRYPVFAARVALTLGGLTLLLFSGGAAGLAAGARRISRGVAPIADALFTLAMLAFLFAVLLPVETYANYVRPRRFGFADRPFSSWLTEAATNWLVTSLAITVGVTIIMVAIRRWPRTWAPVAGGVYLAIGAAMTLATPTLIEPLFNHYTPLPDSPMKRDILSLAQANGVAAQDVFTSDASRQTRILNAHVSGTGHVARITLDDNTLGVYPPSIRMVVGHEIGHFVMGHVDARLVVDALITTAGLLVIAWLGPILIGRNAARWRIQAGAGAMGQTAAIAVLWLLLQSWAFLAQPVQNAFIRGQEAQADLYGLNASGEPNGFAEFMIHDADTSRLDPTPLDVFLFYDHPGAKSRVETAMRWRAAHMPPVTGPPGA